MNRRYVRRAVSVVIALGVMAPAFFLDIGEGKFSLNMSAAEASGFDRWVERLWPSARRKGISRTTFRRAFAGLEPDPSVIKSNSNQAEFKQKIWDYLERAVSDARIETGREMLKKYKSILDAIETLHGVDRHIIIAIWGMETRYGSYMGDKNVIRSLATLGYRGRRRKFGRQQLLAALKILQRGDITPARMTGSWAGAMGHTQFIPTTYNAYAVDFDKDGKRDIWGTIPDALASTANYLRISRWRGGQTWGYEVTLPKGFRYRLAGKKRRKSIRAWMKLGVKRVRGKAFPRPRDSASLILPAGARGPAFLILNNFRSILRYNNANAYALSVGHLADRLRGGPAFATPWPVSRKPPKPS